ncbi:hypothetical protein [Streptomyces fumanus]|uniref:hypothetical protein n=1 Tax=Streptomyces fumanus TaxID=67302 RepID=UPI0033F6C0AF
MRHHHSAAAILAAALLALTACTTSDDSTDAAPKASASAPEKAPGLTAKQAAAKLAEATGVTDLGDEQDNTGSCSNEAAGKDPSPNDCTQLITTDTVSVYEFPSEKVAAHWAKTMKTSGDFRQVGRYALAWTARDQDLTSDERRDDLVAALKKATAE